MPPNGANGYLHEHYRNIEINRELKTFTAREIKALRRPAETVWSREKENKNPGQKEYRDLTLVALALVCIYILFLITIGF